MLWTREAGSLSPLVTYDTLSEPAAVHLENRYETLVFDEKELTPVAGEP